MPDWFCWFQWPAPERLGGVHLGRALGHNHFSSSLLPPASPPLGEVKTGLSH